MLLSFIIPAYNCARYIGTCLDSVLAQGLDKNDYEVIVINDGSTDDTEQIVRAYCLGNENFRLISTPNQGAGLARNEGIVRAGGRYVYFMDADDRLLPGGMKTLIDCYVVPEGYPDVVSFFAHTVDRYYRDEEWERIRPHALLFKGSPVECAQMRGVSNSIWSQLISRKLLEVKHLVFSNHKIGEDMLFMLRLYRTEDATVLATSLDIYRYHVRTGSAMNSTENDHLLSVFDSLTDLSARLKELKQDDGYPYDVLEADIDICKRWGFTRLASASLGYRTLCTALDKAGEKHFFALDGNRSVVNRFIRWMSCHPVWFYLFSRLYRGFFLPYIKPCMKRN